jgi:predicted alpha/beta superfamily hydrolase
MRTICVAFLIAALPAPALPQNAANRPIARHVIQSAKLGEARTIFVVTPASYDGGSARFPVLVLLDADDQPQFTAAVANISFLASRSAIPNLIIVGVPNGKDRTHDLTPRARGSTAKAFQTAGGAADFVAFITDEALPLVRTTYRTMPSTVLAGHSFGGLLAVHAAAAHPGTFNGIVAMSPSLWWNDTTAAVAYADSIARSTSPLRLFASSGGLEAVIDGPTRRFSARVDSLKHANLAFSHRRYPSDTHGLTPLPSLVDGLRFVFEPVSLANPAVFAVTKPDSARVVNAFLALQQQYATGARALGVPEGLPEPFVNSLGYQVLGGMKLPAAAVWIFRHNVTHYPDSPNVYDSLGDGLLAVGDSVGAKAQFKQAVDVAARTNQPVADETRKKLAALDSAAKK